MTSHQNNNPFKLALDLIGKKFGNWIVIARVKNRYNKSYWEVHCTCGNKCFRSGSALKNNLTLSCRSCVLKKRNQTHGYCLNGKKPLEYHIWNSIKNRCLNSNSKPFKNYGGRGINICDRWKKSFVDFLNDMGKKPFPGASIDRIDNDGDYCPENCRWTTSEVQCSNTRKSITINGKKNSVTKLAREMNRCRFFVAKNLKAGYSVDEISKMDSKPFKSYR